MRLHRFIFFSILFFYATSSHYSLYSQPRKISFSAENLDYDEELLPGVQRLVGNVVFYQGKTTGYCDSAHFHESRNLIEAFGEQVRIYVNDSVTLYGQYLIYDGNKRLASISRDVILMDKSTTLYTDSLIYDLNKEIGYYLTGGKTVDKENTLTSIIGYYHTKKNKIYLYQDVNLVNNSYSMDCDSLEFNTQTETAYFISRTHLVSDENDIYTNSGWYNVKLDHALLIDDVLVITKNQELSGDSIYYDKKERFGRGWKNVEVKDTVKGYIIRGNYLEHHETGGLSMATDSALLILIDKQDSLYLHADTLKALFDSLQEPQLIYAYNHTKFYRSDLQGACDSLSYLPADSLLTMYYNPVVWSGENQLSADTIRFLVIDSVYTQIHLLKSGFIVSSLFEDTDFNQIKGITITGLIYNKELTKVDVVGNAECLYYMQESDSSLIGINYSLTSEMTIRLEENEVSSISFYNHPDGKIYPDNQLVGQDRFLKDFRWLSLYRPKLVADIFHTPIPRTKEESTNTRETSDD